MGRATRIQRLRLGAQHATQNRAISGTDPFTTPAGPLSALGAWAWPSGWLGWLLLVELLAPGPVCVEPFSTAFDPLLVAQLLVDYAVTMSRVEELERAIEELPNEEFERLSIWMVQRSAKRGRGGGEGPLVVRDHSAFLNSYSPEDEGLYDDAAGR